MERRFVMEGSVFVATLFGWAENVYVFLLLVGFCVFGVIVSTVGSVIVGAYRDGKKSRNASVRQGSVQVDD